MTNKPSPDGPPAITTDIQYGHALETQSVLVEVLQLSLTNENLAGLLEKALDLILSVSWLNILKKGGIFLTDESGARLNLVASHDLGPQINSLCARVPFGHCLCGRAAATKKIQFASCVDHRHDVRFDEMKPHGHYNVPLIGESGAVLGVLVLYLEHGHQKSNAEAGFLEIIAKALSSLIERKKILRRLALYENAVDQHSIVSRTDVQGNITYINDRFCEISGYSPEELIGQNHRIVKSGHHQKSDFANLYKQAATQGLWKGTLRNTAKNGEDYWVETTVIPDTDIRGKVIGYFSIRTDVSQVYQQSKELARKNAEFETSLENMAQGLCLYDKDRKLVVCNWRYAQIYGLPDWLANPGTKFEDVLDHLLASGQYDTPDPAAYISNKIQGIESSTAWSKTEATLDGRHIEINFRPMSDGGWLTTHTDITESVEREKQLAKAKIDAQVAARAKSDFLSTMSHEIRTPLNGVLGMASLLQETELDDTQNFYAQTISNSGEALLLIINDILDLSKMEVGKMELVQEPFDLEKTLLETLQLLSQSAAKKGIELILDYPAEIQTQFLGDVGRIRQVITNLVGNAEKFTKEGSVSIKVSGETKGEIAQLAIAIKDTGIGIAPNKLEAIFGAFSQADSTTTRNFGGTGLGLSIASRLARLMQGKINVTSELGSGTAFTFCVDLPVVAKEGSLPRNSVPNSTNKRALVVTDNLLQGSNLAKQLTSAGFASVSVANSKEALQMLEETETPAGQFDIAIIDQQLANNSGLKMAKQISTSAQNPDVPVIMLTPINARPTKQELAESNVAAMLNKPYSLGMLRDTTRRALNPENSQSPNATVCPRAQHSGSTNQPMTQRQPPIQILIAEDNKTNRLIVQAMLKDVGATLEFATNGVEAVEKFKARRPDIMFMDISMPQMDGIKATQFIRAFEAEQNAEPCPIIALTANVLEGNRKTFLESGMDDYLSKPFNKSDLRSKVSKWAARK